MNENYIYEYQLLSSGKSEQNIDAFYVEIHSDVTQITSPPEWLGSVSEARKKIVYWGSRGREFDIAPKEERNEFGFASKEMPSVVTYYSSGYIETPKVPEGEAPPLESIVGADIFENSIQGKTIGPRKLPDDISDSALLDTLYSYLTFSCDTIWIENRGVCRSLEAKLDNVARQLERGNTKTAANNLQAFLNELQALKENQLSSEAFALLYYNGEYLLDQLRNP
ncbi:MAG: hypothetical protein U5J95_08340 [Balneolaceae bacterium]|nr:hypothetical protein [Balneolaceae bacterium]